MIAILGSFLVALGHSPSSAGATQTTAEKQQTKTVKRTTDAGSSRRKVVKPRSIQKTPTRRKAQAVKATKSSPARVVKKLAKGKGRRNSVVRRRVPRQEIPPTPSYSFLNETPPLPPPHTFAAALLADAETGQVLFSFNDHREWPTASLAKMMVALLTLEAVERKEVAFTTPVPISIRASRAGGRTIRLRAGEEFSLEAMLQAMMVTSANDAAVALAERLKGSVEACVEAMNRRAFQLGMTETLFQTPNGMPLTDGTPPDMSSAADLMILGRVLAKHSWLLFWTSLDRIPFRDGRMSLPNTNRLVGRVQGVDGLKTGFTAKARFNLVTTAQRGSRRLIAVVLGGQSSRLRFHTAENLLEWGFAHLPRSNTLEESRLPAAPLAMRSFGGAHPSPLAEDDISSLIDGHSRGSEPFSSMR